MIKNEWINEDNKVIEFCFECDADIWFPNRPDVSKYKFKTQHVCCPKRQKQAIEEWLALDEAKRTWPPMCPNLCPIEISHMNIIE